MFFRAILGTTLIVAVGTQAAAAAPLSGNSSTRAAAKAAAPVAHWDTQIIETGVEVPGMNDPARESVERWRTFAEKRGYRIDLDPSQRILVLSDGTRFKNFSGSMAIIERVLEETEAMTGPRKTPAVILRASESNDERAARTAVDALGLGGQVFTMLEQGTYRERRAVDARLAEAVAVAELKLHAPHLSEWMVDGIASAIAEECTKRAIINGQAVNMRSVQNSVSKEARARDHARVSLFDISGTNGHRGVSPKQAEAMAVVAYLRKHQAEAFAQIVSDLGQSDPQGHTGKFKQEERVIRKHCGLDALGEIERALQKGRAYRPK